VYNQLVLDVAEATTVQAVIEQFKLPSAMAHLVLVNGVFIPRRERATRPLRAGDALAVWPPIAGG
jgi:sulfur carrier protein ThiS